MPKAEVVPASGFQEPSEPSDIRPEDQERAQLKSTQQENPQLMAHQKGAQASERGGESRGHTSTGKTPSWKKDTGKPRL